MHQSPSHPLLTGALFAMAGSLLSLAQASAMTATARTEFPPPSCDTTCSAPQTAIWHDYQAAKALDATNANTPSPQGDLFSGECYHSSTAFDAGQAHHGVVLLQPTLDDDGLQHLLFRAEFSFFAKTNPYRTWTSDDADRKLKQADPTKNRLSLADDGAFVDFNPGHLPIWRYWMRRSDDEQRLFLIGSWGYHHHFFCALTRNADCPPSSDDERPATSRPTMCLKTRRSH